MRYAATLALGIVHTLEAGDHRLMRRVNRWRPPRWVRLWMLYATRCGDGWLWYPLGFLILAAGGSERVPALASGLGATGTGILIFRWLKRRIGRARPCSMNEHCWSTLLPPDQFSFPSGHTITAFAIAGTIGYSYPVLSGGLWFCASSVAVSRVILGMHFLTDVIVGAAMGSFLAIVAVQATRMLA